MVAKYHLSHVALMTATSAADLVVEVINRMDCAAGEDVQPFATRIMVRNGKETRIVRYYREVAP